MVRRSNRSKQSDLLDPSELTILPKPRPFSRLVIEGQAVLLIDIDQMIVRDPICARLAMAMAFEEDMGLHPLKAPDASQYAADLMQKWWTNPDLNPYFDLNERLVMSEWEMLTGPMGKFRFKQDRPPVHHTLLDEFGYTSRSRKLGIPPMGRELVKLRTLFYREALQLYGCKRDLSNASMMRLIRRVTELRDHPRNISFMPGAASFLRDAQMSGILLVGITDGAWTDFQRAKVRNIVNGVREQTGTKLRFANVYVSGDQAQDKHGPYAAYFALKGIPDHLVSNITRIVQVGDRATSDMASALLANRRIEEAFDESGKRTTRFVREGSRKAIPVEGVRYDVRFNSSARELLPLELTQEEYNATITTIRHIDELRRILKLSHLHGKPISSERSSAHLPTLQEAFSAGVPLDYSDGTRDTRHGRIKIGRRLPKRKPETGTKKHRDYFAERSYRPFGTQPVCWYGRRIGVPMFEPMPLPLVAIERAIRGSVPFPDVVHAISSPDDGCDVLIYLQRRAVSLGKLPITQQKALVPELASVLSDLHGITELTDLDNQAPFDWRRTTTIYESGLRRVHGMHVLHEKHREIVDPLLEMMGLSTFCDDEDRSYFGQLLPVLDVLRRGKESELVLINGDVRPETVEFVLDGVPRKNGRFGSLSLTALELSRFGTPEEELAAAVNRSWLLRGNIREFVRSYEGISGRTINREQYGAWSAVEDLSSVLTNAIRSSRQQHPGIHKEKLIFSLEAVAKFCGLSFSRGEVAQYFDTWHRPYARAAAGQEREPISDLSGLESGSFREITI